MTTQITLSYNMTYLRLC